MNKVVFFVFMLLSFTAVIAQTNSIDICKEGDCPESIFAIQLNESPTSEQYTSERTEKFKQAYNAFKPIREVSQANLDWREKYDAFQLGGACCLRYYQLESTFGKEFLNNSAFKAYVEKEDPKGAKQLARNGFRSSRRASNLARRMESRCPERKAFSETKGKTPVSTTEKEYQELGQSLGYFDDKGNQIKELEPPKEYKPRKQMSKRERVENLNNKVAALPIGPQAREKLDKVSGDLKKATPKFEGLKNFISAFSPLVSSFLPNPISSLASIEKITDLLGKLKNVKLKFPKLGLIDKIKSLFGKGNKLKDKAQELVGKGNKLLDKTNSIKDKIDKAGKEFKDRADAIGGLQDKLKDLENKKQEVLNKLADKPKKIIEQLENEIADLENEAKAFKDLLDDEVEKKDKLLKQLDKLETEKEKLEKNLQDLQKENDDLVKDAKELQKEAGQVEQQVEEAKKQEAELDKAVDKIADVPGEQSIKENLKICEDDLRKFLAEISPVEEAQTALNKNMDKIKDLPEKLRDKLSNIKLFQNKLKKDKNGNPVAKRSLDKLDDLSDKANKVGSILEVLTGKRTKLQDRLEKIDGEIDQAKGVYDNRTGLVDKLKNDAIGLLLEKSGLEKKLNQATGTAENVTKEINDFIERFNRFKDESECIDLKDLEGKLEETKKGQADIEPEMEELEKDLEEVDKEQEKIQQETEKVAEDLKEEIQRAEELVEEQEDLKKQFGEDVKLEPVEPKEWAEGFEVKRDYWEAVFHPDDEVVEDYKGRYFKVRLKDAEKNIKLLFGSGEYFMERGDFRDTYGPVIGIFVTEALNAMRKADRDGIKLFVQGSADITGQNTFKGNLSDKFKYNEVTVLPMKGESGRFESKTKALEIPKKGFTNNDLPNLRGNFLKEMISIYSRKLEPVLLEGSVTEKVDIEDRNAVIYLFIPAYLVEAYSQD
jgi:DNA repair ATPase RecN